MKDERVRRRTPKKLDAERPRRSGQSWGASVSGADRTALVAALLLEGPLCLECMKTKSGLAQTDEIVATLRRVVRLLVLRRYELDRCRACGEEHQVFVLERADA